MSILDDHFVLMQASIYSKNEYFYKNIKNRMYTLPSIPDNLIENIDHIFHQYQISAPENEVEDDGLSEITKSTSKTKPSKSDLSGFWKLTQLIKMNHFHQLMPQPW